jgi:hypothetical protein
VSTGKREIKHRKILPGPIKCNGRQRVLEPKATVANQFNGCRQMNRSAPISDESAPSENASLSNRDNLDRPPSVPIRAKENTASRESSAHKGFLLQSHHLDPLPGKAVQASIPKKRTNVRRLSSESNRSVEFLQIQDQKWNIGHSESEKWIAIPRGCVPARDCHQSALRCLSNVAARSPFRGSAQTREI